MNGADLVRDHHDELLQLLVVAIADHIPGFNDGIEDTSHPLRRQRQRALQLSLTGMADAIDAQDGHSATPMDWSEHIELGRMERHYQRPLSDILRAPWIASRTIVRFIGERAPDVGLPLAAAQLSSELVIEWSDQISIAFSQGYNDETAARAGELETHRQHLLRTLLADTPPTTEAVQAAAIAAEWRPPPTVRVLIAKGPDRRRYRRRLPAGSIAAEMDDELVALLPLPADITVLDPDTTADTLAALGPPTGTDDAARSARLARRSIELANRRSGPTGQLMDCTTNELDLVAFADVEAACDFSQRRLDPILSNPTLTVTLHAWLNNQGRPKATAQALDVHPHTITYRINQIRQHLGPSLDNPQHRLELHLATHIALDRQIESHRTGETQTNTPA